MYEKMLTKTRILAQTLESDSTDPADYAGVLTCLSKLFQAQTLLVSGRGKRLAQVSFGQETSPLSLPEEGRLAPECNDNLLALTEPTVASDALACLWAAAIQTEVAVMPVTVVPVTGRKQRLGTLLLHHPGYILDEGDLILTRLGAALIGKEILREKQRELEDEARELAIAELAVGALSFSEQEAVERILVELEGEREGLMVASKVADEAGITRSVIVNALRKLESAGVIESRSLGMKGTFVRILNERLPDLVTRQGR